MDYSFNAIKKDESLAYAQRYDINASYKDLGAVCDAIRYRSAGSAMQVLDKIIEMKRAVLYRRHNKHMGARHELGGRKGAYPVKAAKEMRLLLLNAIANAANNALNGDEMMIIHASANKTRIERRYPSKGSLAWGRGMYGRSALMHSDIEYAKIELVLADKDHPKLTESMKYFIKKLNKPEREVLPPASRPKAERAKPAKTEEKAKLEEKKPEAKESK
jgi:large subunit ribosomal protein L22